MKIIVAIALLFMSVSVFSQKTLITGKPIELEVNQGNYTFPDSYYDRNKGYHYVTFMGTERVCFLKEASNLASLDMVSILIVDNGRTLPWVCYRYNSQYFERDF